MVNDLILATALSQVGIMEVPGEKNNPKIIEYAQFLGFDWYQNDEISWCGVFAGWVVANCGGDIPEFRDYTSAATARRWLEMGEERSVEEAQPGMVCVFSRGNDPKYGHVGFFCRWDQERDYVYVLGGNQGRPGGINISPYPRKKLLGIREI